MIELESPLASAIVALCGKVPFHRLGFGCHRIRDTRSPVGLDHYADPRRASRHGLDRALHDRHHLTPIVAFDHGEHRIGLIRQPGIPHHADCFGDDLTDAFADAERCDGECDQYGHNTTLLAAHGSIGAMRVLVQRVSSATVSVDQHVVGSIRPNSQGLLALVGITHDDDIGKAQRLAEKLWQLRILDDERSAADINAPIMVISQFTLYADTAKGRRPSWNAAAPGAVAEPLIDAFAQALRRQGADVETGKFGAHMQVELINDGPVTVLLEL